MLAAGVLVVAGTVPAQAQEGPESPGASVSCLDPGVWQKVFGYAGRVTQSCVVPAGVTDIRVDAWGGQGGGVVDVVRRSYGGDGGMGSQVVSVTPGQTLWFVAAGAGGTYDNSGAGGGASWVATTQYPNELAQMIAVGGGGGGGGHCLYGHGGDAGAAQANYGQGRGNPGHDGFDHAAGETEPGAHFPAVRQDRPAFLFTPCRATS